MASVVADGVKIELHTIFVKKRRFSRLGLQIQGCGHPAVVAAADDRFQVGDMLYIINGRETRSAGETSFRIWRKRFLSITLYRSSA